MKWNLNDSPDANGTKGATRAVTLPLGSGNTSSQYWATSRGSAPASVPVVPVAVLLLVPVATGGFFARLPLENLNAKNPPTPRTSRPKIRPTTIGTFDRGTGGLTTGATVSSEGVSTGTATGVVGTG